MGVTPQHLLDDWDSQQRQDYAQKNKLTMVKLPCCGSAVEASPQQGDQFVTCPNKSCPKARELGRAPRHKISWGHRTTITGERPPLEL